MPDRPPLLRAETLVTGYGKKQVLRGVSLELHEAEKVAIIGHNGAGKSTLLKALFGLLPLWNGTISLAGQLVIEPMPRHLLHSGVVYVPQGSRIFTDLSVHENLKVGYAETLTAAQRADAINRVLTLFPELEDRLRHRAGTLSGGEKQMLALGRALVLSPRVLLLDEPSLGLAPAAASATLRTIQDLSCRTSTAVLIVEQRVREVLRIVDRVYVLRNGQAVYSGPASPLHDEQSLRAVYL